MTAFGSIRWRLTAWYLLMLAAGMGLCGFGSWFGMRTSAFGSIDEELKDRMSAVEEFLKRQIAASSPTEIREEFLEQSVLGPGGDLFQVCDEDGEWLYRSAVLENSQVPVRLPGELGGRPIYEDLVVQGAPVRFATGRVTVNRHRYAIQIAAPLNEFLRALGRFRLMLWLSAPVLMIGAGYGGYWISGRALRPVDQITASAESISIRNLSDRLEVPATSDELQRLSETLNRMLARLDSSVRRISQFTADASHELRAPVSVIRTTAELAVQAGRANTDSHADMVQILAEAERTSRLIDSLLLLARADAGEVGLQHELTNLSTPISEALAQSSSLATQKRIDLRADIKPETIVVRADGEALRRLFFILIENGIKYTAEGGRVRLDLQAFGGQAIIKVEDSGIGISEADQPHIFDRFWRADRARSRATGGAGLGLSIALWIVNQHQGAIEVQSQANQGTTFTVRLPIADLTGVRNQPF
jgi:heavy metal sensor kinase